LKNCIWLELLFRQAHSQKMSQPQIRLQGRSTQVFHRIQGTARLVQGNVMGTIRCPEPITPCNRHLCQNPYRIKGRPLQGIDLILQSLLDYMPRTLIRPQFTMRLSFLLDPCNQKRKAFMTKTILALIMVKFAARLCLVVAIEASKIAMVIQAQSDRSMTNK